MVAIGWWNGWCCVGTIREGQTSMAGWTAIKAQTESPSSIVVGMVVDAAYQYLVMPGDYCA